VGRLVDGVYTYASRLAVTFSVLPSSTYSPHPTLGRFNQSYSHSKLRCFTTKTWLPGPPLRSVSSVISLVGMELEEDRSSGIVKVIRECRGRGLIVWRSYGMDQNVAELPSMLVPGRPTVPELKMDQLGQGIWDDLQTVVEERIKSELSTEKVESDGKGRGGGERVVVPDDVYA
jgi:hypothetical protein